MKIEVASPQAWRPINLQSAESRGQCQSKNVLVIVLKYACPESSASLPPTHENMFGFYSW